MTAQPFPDLIGAHIGLGGLVPTNGCHGWRVGEAGVQTMAGLADGSVTFVAFLDRTIAIVAPAPGAVAIYPVPRLTGGAPQGLYVDLDGTLIDSEPLWISIIEQTLAQTSGRPGFRFPHSARVHVSGRSVGAHLEWAIKEFAPDISIATAQMTHARLAREALTAVISDGDRADVPTLMPGFRTFMDAVKASGLPVALVTSGVEAKMWPTLAVALRRAGFPDPQGVFPTILCGGTSAADAPIGSLSDLPMKPHPWLYAEARAIGLKLPSTAPGIAVEDSAAGAIAARIAGLSVIGLASGNISDLGASCLCVEMVANLDEAAQAIQRLTTTPVTPV